MISQVRSVDGVQMAEQARIQCNIGVSGSLSGTSHIIWSLTILAAVRSDSMSSKKKSHANLPSRNFPILYFIPNYF